MENVHVHHQFLWNRFGDFCCPKSIYVALKIKQKTKVRTWDELIGMCKPVIIYGGER